MDFFKNVFLAPTMVEAKISFYSEIFLTLKRAVQRQWLEKKSMMQVITRVLYNKKVHFDGIIDIFSPPVFNHEIYAR